MEIIFLVDVFVAALRCWGIKSETSGLYLFFVYFLSSLDFFRDRIM